MQAMAEAWMLMLLLLLLLGLLINTAEASRLDEMIKYTHSEIEELEINKQEMSYVYRCLRFCYFLTSDDRVMLTIDVTSQIVPRQGSALLAALEEFCTKLKQKIEDDYSHLLNEDQNSIHHRQTEDSHQLKRNQLSEERRSSDQLNHNEFPEDLRYLNHKFSHQLDYIASCGPRMNKRNSKKLDIAVSGLFINCFISYD